MKGTTTTTQHKRQPTGKSNDFVHECDYATYKWFTLLRLCVCLSLSLCIITLARLDSHFLRVIHTHHTHSPLSIQQQQQTLMHFESKRKEANLTPCSFQLKRKREQVISILNYFVITDHKVST